MACLWANGLLAARLVYYPREFDPYLRQFLIFPERFWLLRASGLPKPNQMTFYDLRYATFSKENGYSDIYDKFWTRQRGS